VRYTPDWEPLADALTRVIATGLNEDEAKTDICSAMADRKVNVQVRVAENERGLPRKFFEGFRVGVPRDLKPGDLDWAHSRPHGQWRIGPVGPDSYSDPYWTWKTRRIDRVELATADVLWIFGSPKSTVKRGEINDDEEKAAVTLGDLLIRNQHLKKADAFKQCQEQYPKLKKRGFEQRVWAKARQLAKLRPKASPGRKPKSPRST
jgi:hypothetical protein